MKNILLFCIALFVMFLPLSTFAQDQDNIERAKVALGIFKRGCFLNHGNVEKSEQFLNSNFPKFDAEKAQIFKTFTRVKEGQVWAANFPKGSFVVVLSNDGNCHVIAQKADKNQIHTGIQSLAKEAESHLDFDIKTHPKQDNQTTESSGFDVVGSNNKNLMVVVASTPKQSAENKPDAMITMAVSSY